jgi:hypothetical protein
LAKCSGEGLSKIELVVLGPSTTVFIRAPHLLLLAFSTVTASPSSDSYARYRLGS